jgi:hypothetical protein
VAPLLVAEPGVLVVRLVMIVVLGNLDGFPGLLVGLLGFTGLSGYVYRERWFGRRFWVVWFPLQLVLHAATLVVQLGQSWSWLVEPAPVRVLPPALVVAFSIPLYVALYRYAHRSRALWDPPVSSTPAGA